MDQFDNATRLEELHREKAIAAERAIVLRDWESDVCHGCDYAVGANYGKACADYAECLIDLQRIERAKRMSGQ